MAAVVLVALYVLPCPNVLVSVKLYATLSFIRVQFHPQWDGPFCCPCLLALDTCF